VQRYFVVIRDHGSAWKDDRPMEDQAGWPAHASFMNSLAKDGFVVVGGPLDGTSDVLLVVRAGSPDEVRRRLERDPWAEADVLRITRLAPWTVRLGRIGIDPIQGEEP
jgi:uncharacterized protein YciI